MDLMSLVRTLGGLGIVLGILVGALWVVRRYDLRLPGHGMSGRDHRLELVEKLPLDARRSVALLRKDGREHLILIAPEGHLILESSVVRTKPEAKTEARPAAARAPKSKPARKSEEVPKPAATFGEIIEQVQQRAGPATIGLKTLIERVPRRTGVKAARGSQPCTLGAPIRVLQTASRETRRA